MPQIQFLRTTTPTKIPAGLEAGEIAFNLANDWMFVGVGGNDILVDDAPVTGYGATATILGVANVAVPAQPTGKGYEIYELGSTGVKSGTTAPTAAASKPGQLFVDTTTPAAPVLKVFDGTSYVPVVSPARVLSIGDDLVNAGAGGRASRPRRMQRW